MSHHFCNNQSPFSNLKAKSIDFVTAIRQVIWTDKMGTILILLVDRNNIELDNVALASEYNFNLISLS